MWKERTMNHGSVNAPPLMTYHRVPNFQPCSSFGSPTDCWRALMSVSIEQPMQIVFKWMFNSVLVRFPFSALEGNRCPSFNDYFINIAVRMPDNWCLLSAFGFSSVTEGIPRSLLWSPTCNRINDINRLNQFSQKNQNRAKLA